ncbi:hypothetical protein MKW98_018277 [Papaver atlanticum]|uniref:Uncharacterized protein n=1 Tax=Papaver atlanticum TaxID=357466 RepID=A0AAD4S4Z2_9MAGN|nr:hypothetical protein MKW98_018277 [Papaver atlanticum]
MENKDSSCASTGNFSSIASHRHKTFIPQAFNTLASSPLSTATTLNSEVISSLSCSALSESLILTGEKFNASNLCHGPSS